jgi:5-(carboxyamino)imidazole ribonucleotide mutase
MSKPVVGIVMGSQSDLEAMEPAAKTLEEFGIPYEIRVISAHRTPEIAFEYASTARERGLKVVIGAAGGAAHLAGVLAGITTIPVIGVPILGKSFNGMDSLLSMVQMPPGVPVGTVGVNAAKNAALLAIRMIGIEDPKVASALEAFKKKQAEAVVKMDEQVSHQG